ncbi:MAG TPA: PQQ-dependent sugar dehydrogenase [Vicinamibacteria bacterium]|nr:PQQ-dependent sugar dehydrogenase [Vicinamibacteria bacterium]
MAGGRALILGAGAAVGLLAGCGSEGPASPGPAPSPSAGACATGAPVAGTPALASTLVAGGLTMPLDVQSAPGDPTRLFVVEQRGRIRIVRGSTVVATPFLDISSGLGCCGERGLLGLAFHPGYAQNGRFYVNYTNPQGHTHVSEFRVTSNADVADPGSERVLLFVAQPFSNHNGGGLAFGPDGRLYIGLGDGGGGGDPQENGQDLGTHLGKMLRIDVDGGMPYAIPADNPFRSTAGALPEIWALGLRNPWRFSFDRGTGELYIADVGQSSREEINVVAANRGGVNYGWNVMEGTACFRPPSGCPTAGLTLPVLDYGRGVGGSVTGGYVYRGCRMPGYHGTYFYGDFVSGTIRSFRHQNGQATEQRDLSGTVGRGIGNVSAFGVDAEGEIYVLDYEGELFRIVPAA